MSGHQLLTVGLIIAFTLPLPHGRGSESITEPRPLGSSDEIVSRGAAVLKADWAAYEDYAWIEEDDVLKSGQWTAKTSQVVFLAGSDFYMPVGADPALLKAEAARRSAESPDQRRARIAKYRKEREANGALIRDFPDAFTFRLTGEETIDGHRAYVLTATPRKRTGPLSLAAKVLSGMRGTVWVDEESFHAVRVKCDVVKPVPVYGILAKVLPGTHIAFAMTPVTDSVWLLGEMKMNLAISKFFFFHSAQVTRTTYSDYRLNSEVLEALFHPPPSA